MNNTKFWGSKSLNTTGVSGSSSLDTKAPASFLKFSKGKKVIGKKLGVAGAILLGLATCIAIVLYIYIIGPAISLASSANVLKVDLGNISKAMTDRDLVALDAILAKTEKDLAVVRADRDQKFGWARNVKVLSLNEYYSDSEHFINAGLDAIAALREASKVVRPFADAAGLKVSADQAPPESTGLMEAFQSWVSIMPEVASQMDGVIAQVDKMGEELKPINVAKYPKNFRGVPIRDNIEFAKNTLSKASDFAPDIKQALTVFPKVLAVGTPTKRYMIIMQNDKELRPTGGFMTNYATFRITNGLLDSDFSSKDMYSVDLTLQQLEMNGRNYDFPDAPAAYTKYLKVEHWFARDMNSSPDFVSSMDQFMKDYKLAGTINSLEIKPIDGIFAIDTNVIAELLEVTGPVTVNGITYTKDNVVLELEKIASLELREQANRKKVLGDLMEAMLKNVFESDKNLWSKLIEKGVDLAVRKHAQVYLFDAEAQALVEKYGLGGRLMKPTLAGDYSMYVSTNLGGDKTNWFVNKEVTHTIEKNGDKWMATVKAKYVYPEPAAEFAPFVKRFRDWARVYAPEGSTFISVDGSQDPSTTENESGKTWFSGAIELGPGETKEMTFKYYLPAGAVDPKAGKYNLYLQKQAGIGAEVHHVIVNGKASSFTIDTDKQVSLSL